MHVNLWEAAGENTNLSGTDCRTSIPTWFHTLGFENLSVFQILKQKKIYTCLFQYNVTSHYVVLQFRNYHVKHFIYN